MSTTTLMLIGPGRGVPTTYLWLSVVLLFLVTLSLWRDARSGVGGMFFTSTFAALAFAFSRVVAVVFSASLMDDAQFPPVVYMALNFACLALAAYALQATLRDVRRSVEGHPRDPDTLDQLEREDDEANDRAARRLRVQSIVLAGVGVVLYWVVPHPGGVAYSAAGLVDASLFVATLGVFGYMAWILRGAVTELRLPLAAMVGGLGLSWVLVIAAGYVVGAAATTLLQISRIADVLTLVCGLLSMQTLRQVVGTHHRSRADRTEEEVAKARAELNLLSRVASDIYEDSSSMIQRQQGHSRDLMRRIESLEKILQVGIKVQKFKSLKDLLEAVARSVREDLGFDTVVVRMLNERTQSFETRAFVGVNPDIRDAVMEHRLPVAEYEQMIEPRYRISRSYFLKNVGPTEGPVPEPDHGDGVLLSDVWADDDRLIVPLTDDDEVTIGYISVEDPEDPSHSVVEAIDSLETIASLAVAAIRNVTYYKEVREKNEKLKLYAEKLSGLNKMKANFVATISHEFRTPLTSIKAYCETLLKNVDNVERDILREFLAVIDEESTRLMTLIEDILDFSQMESGAIKFERAPCNLNDTMADALQELDKNFQRKNITLTARMPESGVMVRAEKELMKQLLINLLHNASKFTPESGHVWVRVEDESVSARIVVEDSGIGIPEDQIENVFEDFHQADSTSTREYGGSGLGLAICKNIVDWHDGKIWVENIPGRGARFVVVIPKKQALVRSHVVNRHGAMRRYEVERYLELVIEMVAELLNVKKASIMTLDRVERELRVDCAIGLDEDIVEHARVKLGEGIAGRVAQDNQSFLVEDVDNDARVSVMNNEYLYDSRSFLSVPVRREGRVLGVINVANPSTKERFDWTDCRLLEMFADRVAVAFERLQGFTDTYTDFESVRATLKSMIEAKRYIDDQSAGTMSAVLSETAHQLRLSIEEAATLQYVFNVYDLGMSRIGYNIVKQPRKLTDEDRRNIEQHTVIGIEMLKAIDTSHEVSDAVLYHHENYDGTGYPGKLAGDEIPILARIVRVADTFSALVSHRPYQKQYAVAEAVDVLKHRSGTLFDPKVVEVFSNVVLKYVDRLESVAPGDEERAASRMGM